jgi:hypothetical protein
MKKHICLLLAILSFTAYSQDFEPSQASFTWTGHPSYTNLSSTLTEFKQNSMMIGWHWQASRTISEKERSNQRNAMPQYQAYHNPDEYTDNCNIILNPEGYSHAVAADFYTVKGMKFEPLADFNPSDPEKLATE